MVFFEQLAGNLLYGIILGAVYGLATMGLSQIFGVLKIVNVGHGAFIMVGAYVAYWMFVLYSVNPILSIPVALVIGLALGLGIFYIVIRRLIGAPELASLLATFGIGIFIEEVAKFFWGPDHRGFSWNIGQVDFGITLIPNTKLLAFFSSVIIALILYMLFQRTRIGAAIRAVVEDREGAMVCGIDVSRIYAMSFGIGIAMTVIGGILLTLFIPVGINPYMGGEYTLKAFVIAVLGGLGSPWGAFIGGFIFGLLENGSYTILGLIPGVEPFSLTRFVAFSALLVILLVKPTGLMGGE
jgi:branched-chain amino acid transport system permease protein